MCMKKKTILQQKHFVFFFLQIVNFIGFIVGYDKPYHFNRIIQFNIPVYLEIYKT